MPNTPELRYRAERHAERLETATREYVHALRHGDGGDATRAREALYVLFPYDGMADAYAELYDVDPDDTSEMLRRSASYFAGVNAGAQAFNLLTGAMLLHQHKNQPTA